MILNSRRNRPKSAITLPPFLLPKTSLSTGWNPTNAGGDADHMNCRAKYSKCESSWWKSMKCLDNTVQTSRYSIWSVSGSVTVLHNWVTKSYCSFVFCQTESLLRFPWQEHVENRRAFSFWLILFHPFVCPSYVMQLKDQRYTPHRNALKQGLQMK